MGEMTTDTDTLVALAAPERIFMPAGWEVLDGTIPVDARAEADDIEYVRADRIEALEAEVARRSEMHECAMAERDDCILDWSDTKAERDRLAEEVERLTDALASHAKRKEGR